MELFETKILKTKEKQLAVCVFMRSKLSQNKARVNTLQKTLQKDWLRA